MLMVPDTKLDGSYVIELLPHVLEGLPGYWHLLAHVVGQLFGWE